MHVAPVIASFNAGSGADLPEINVFIFNDSIQIVHFHLFEERGGLSPLQATHFYQLGPVVVLISRQFWVTLFIGLLRFFRFIYFIPMLILRFRSCTSRPMAATSVETSIE